jgi:hypothetical protein
MLNPAKPMQERRDIDRIMRVGGSCLAFFFFFFLSSLDDQNNALKTKKRNPTGNRLEGRSRTWTTGVWERNRTETSPQLFSTANEEGAMMGEAKRV